MKPHELIRQAVADLLLCDEDPDYSIQFYDWHTPVESVCSVCLAGAYMAKTLKADRTLPLLPMDFEETEDLRFLNFVRGSLSVASMEEVVGKLDWTDYPNPKVYVQDMSQVPLLLERADWFEKCTPSH
jgi:hypothetical protein